MQPNQNQIIGGYVIHFAKCCFMHTVHHICYATRYLKLDHVVAESTVLFVLISDYFTANNNKSNNKVVHNFHSKNTKICYL